LILSSETRGVFPYRDWVPGGCGTHSYVKKFVRVFGRKV
jgi:hypothetical protein